MGRVSRASGSPSSPGRNLAVCLALLLSCSGQSSDRCVGDLSQASSEGGSTVNPGELRIFTPALVSLLRKPRL